MSAFIRDTFYICGVLEIIIGSFLFVNMILSFVNPEYVLHHFLVIPLRERGLISSNSWAQAAVAFGMHAYADIANGIEICLLSISKNRITVCPTITYWNSTRFLVSFLWLVYFIDGTVKIHSLDLSKWPVGTSMFIVTLAIDSLILRPVAVFCQRRINDVYPSQPLIESNEWNRFTTTQRFCRCVFYYEAIISGCSGAVYFLCPQLFVWLYFPQVKDNFLTKWCLGQFGINVMAFGLYQMNADIDTRTGHVVWWLALDVVWMFFYWRGVSDVLGPWNPFTLSGANYWCHIAFHADSTLALARVIFLLTLLVNGRPKHKVK